MVTIESFKQNLTKSHPALVSVYAALAAFFTYSCMYAFRKPFTAATFENIFVWGLKYKDVLVISQLVGYTLSKFLGIKIIAEMKSKNRGINILKLILFAATALLFFALTPAPYNIVFLFLNGIPLGMVWGIVFSFLEGRKTTEFMGSVMAVSFIFSSGFVKSVGKMLLKSYAMSEFWMPLATGLIFLLPMLFFIFLLEQIPDPSAEDIAHRTERKPMTTDERKDFIKSYLPGIVVLVIAYVMLTIMRDFRDNFAADIWKELGYNDASLFTETEIPVSLAILLFMSFLILIKDNLLALKLNHLIVAFGFLVAGGSTFLYVHQFISAFWWMVLNGLGLYLGYVPFNVVFFERKIAAIRKPANVGFLMYVADSFGYLGSIGILLFKNFGAEKMSYSNFFIRSVYIVSAIGIVFMFFSMVYFNRKIKADKV
jgi:MFS family permease